MRYKLLTEDCIVSMQQMEVNSIDSIVTDPPYVLSFMGKDWDHGVPGIHFWQEALRVAKPGAHLLAFGGTRTHHRLACSIEDAGWEIRDMIMWVYGSGFPKSSNQKGDYKGWGTALKPAWEPIIMARKPFTGTVAGNMNRHGVGAINIDGCRVETADNLNGGAYSKDRKPSTSEWVAGGGTIHNSTGLDYEQPIGRWPANVIHDGSDEVVEGFPNSKSTGGSGAASGLLDTNGIYGNFSGKNKGSSAGGFGDNGSASRFFYCAKTSKKERGVDNIHPTVKPINLMRYLCRLVTPSCGLVYDPFTGSGSTGVAVVSIVLVIFYYLSFSLGLKTVLLLLTSLGLYSIGLT